MYIFGIMKRINGKIEKLKWKNKRRNGKCYKRELYKNEKKSRWEN